MILALKDNSILEWSKSLYPAIILLPYIPLFSLHMQPRYDLVTYSNLFNNSTTLVQSFMNVRKYINDYKICLMDNYALLTAFNSGSCFLAIWRADVLSVRILLQFCSVALCCKLLRMLSVLYIWHVGALIPSVYKHLIVVWNMDTSCFQF